MKMALEENRFHEEIITQMRPEIQQRIDALVIIDHMGNKLSRTDREHIQGKQSKAPIDGARELLDVLMRLYPDAFVKFVEAVYKTQAGDAGPLLALSIYNRVPDKFKDKFEYIFPDLKCEPAKPSDDVVQQQQPNQLSRPGAGNSNIHAVRQSDSMPEMAVGRPAPSLPIRHQSMPNDSIQFNLSLEDNTSVGCGLLEEMDMETVEEVCRILNENDQWKPLARKLSFAMHKKIRKSKDPSLELFDVFMEQKWTVQRFLEDAQSKLSSELFEKVSSTVDGTSVCLGAEGGGLNQSKITNNSVDQSLLSGDFSTNRQVSSYVLQRGEGQHCTTHGEQLSCQPAEIGLSPQLLSQATCIQAAQTSRPAQSNHANQPAQNLQPSSKPNHNVPKPRQAVQSPQQPVCEPSSSNLFLSDQFTQNTARPTTLSPTISQTAVGADAFQAIRTVVEYAGVQSESDPDSQQAGKGPGQEAQRFREDISAEWEAASAQQEAVPTPLPAVEDPEGVLSEKNSDLERHRLHEDAEAAEELEGFENIQRGAIPDIPVSASQRQIGGQSAVGNNRESSGSGGSGTEEIPFIYRPQIGLFESSSGSLASVEKQGVPNERPTAEARIITPEENTFWQEILKPDVVQISFGTE